MFDNLVEKLKANPKRIVYTEGTDARILESAARLKKDGFLTPVLLGNVEDVKAAAAKGGFDIEGLEIIDPENYDGMDAMVEQMVELRRGKMTADECRRRAEEEQLLRHDARQDGSGRLPARRRDLFHRRHRASRAAAGQDEARPPSGQLLRHPDPRR